jgi:tetratricopeptide (TPR) repeat protein
VRAAKQQTIADATLGVAWSDLGFAYRMIGRCWDATGALKEAESTFRRVPQSGALIRANGVSLLAGYLECGELDLASKYWSRTLAPLAESSDVPDMERAPLWAAGGTLESARKHYAASEALYAKAIAAWEREPARRADRLMVALIHRGVDRAYLHQTEAAKLDADRAAGSLPVLTSLAPSMRISAFNNLGLIYLMGRHFDDAAIWFIRSINGLQEFPHCQCAPIVLGNYAEYLRQTGNAKEAGRIRGMAEEAGRKAARESAGGTVDVSSFRSVGAHK